MVHGVAAEALILRTACTLVANQVGPGAADAGGAGSFVGVDHDVVVGSLLDAVLVVVVHPLAVVVFAARHDVAHVAALHGGIAVVYHELVCLVQVAFVVACRSRGLVVHDHLHALRGGVAVYLLHVEVGVGGHEVEYVVLLVAEPVFPAHVPSFNQHSIEAVFGGEVNVALHVGRVGRVCAVGFGVGKVGFAQLHGRKVVGVAPGALVGNHVPPYAYIFSGLDPRGILDFARFVQVQRQARSQDVGSLVAHHDGAPGRHAGSLQVAFVAASVGGEPALEGHGLVIVVEVHRGVVDTGSFVQVDVESVGRFHHQGSLYAAFPDGSLRGVLRHGILHLAAYFAQL